MIECKKTHSFFKKCSFLTNWFVLLSQLWGDFTVLLYSPCMFSLPVQLSRPTRKRLFSHYGNWQIKCACNHRSSLSLGIAAWNGTCIPSVLSYALLYASTFLYNSLNSMLTSICTFHG